MHREVFLVSKFCLPICSRKQLYTYTKVQKVLWLVIINFRTAIWEIFILNYFIANLLIDISIYPIVLCDVINYFRFCGDIYIS